MSPPSAGPLARSARVLWGLAVSAAALCLTGCYSYVPLQGPPTSVNRGTALQIHLTHPIDLKMGDIGANNVVEIDAEMIEDEGDSLAVSVFQTTAQSGYQQAVAGRTAKVPLDAIGGIDLRSFSAVKTLLVGGAVVAAAIAAAAVLASGGSGGSNTNPPPHGQ